MFCAAIVNKSQIHVNISLLVFEILVVGLLIQNYCFYVVDG